jgi:hypothetical protein
MHESSYPTSGTRSTNNRSTARTSSADFAQRTRAIVPSSRKALSSPFLQHHPLHREQAVRATRPAKPSGSGRKGETECSEFFMLRNVRKVTTKCLRSRLTRSGDIGTAALSFLGTITGKPSSSSAALKFCRRMRGSI